jgi:hypothetical protein
VAGIQSVGVFIRYKRLQYDQLYIELYIDHSFFKTILLLPSNSSSQCFILGIIMRKPEILLSSDGRRLSVRYVDPNGRHVSIFVSVADDARSVRFDTDFEWSATCNLEQFESRQKFGFGMIIAHPTFVFYCLTTLYSNASLRDGKMDRRCGRSKCAERYGYHTVRWEDGLKVRSNNFIRQLVPKFT